MPKYRGTVILTKTWEGVEVEADDEAKAEGKLSNMADADLNNFDSPSEDVEIEGLEEIEEEKNEDESSED